MKWNKWHCNNRIMKRGTFVVRLSSLTSINQWIISQIISSFRSTCQLNINRFPDWLTACDVTQTWCSVIRMVLPYWKSMQAGTTKAYIVQYKNYIWVPANYVRQLISSIQSEYVCCLKPALLPHHISQTYTNL